MYDNDCNDDMLKNGEKNILKLIVYNCDVDSVIMDVGANIGDWSVALINEGYHGRLVAVDPLSENLEKVRKKLTGLNYKNFDLCECALNNRIEKLKFFVNKDEALSGHDSIYDMRKLGYEADIDCVDVQSTTLDELAIKKNIIKINFLKIDVEGNELNVLKGAANFLSKGDIDFIQIEFGHAARAARIYLHDIVQFVHKYDYEIFVIKPKGLMRLNFSPFIENRYSYINFLIVRKGLLSKVEVCIMEH